MNEIDTTAAAEAMVEKCDAMIAEWEAGRMTSPDQRDYVIAGCEALGIDWTTIQTDVERIADVLYEDCGETYVTFEDMAAFVLPQLVAVAS